MTLPEGNDVALKELVRRHWDGRAATFDEASQHGIHDDEQRERWSSLLRSWTGQPPLRVLDVGCGTGVLSLLLAALGHHVTGTDFAPGMLERARGKPRPTDGSVEFHRGDAEVLGYSDDAFGLVVARHLVWTLPSPGRAVGEWQRVVEPGGRILLMEGYWDHPEPWDEYEEVHDDLPMYHGRPPEELCAFLEGEGLRNVEHEPLMDPVLWGREPRHEYYVVAGEVPA